MGIKSFKLFFGRRYADIQASDLIVRKQFRSSNCFFSITNTNTTKTKKEKVTIPGSKYSLSACE